MDQQIKTHIQLQVENRDRFSVFFRVLLVIPIAVFAGSFDNTFDNNSSTHYWLPTVFVFPVVLAILFRGIYPSYVYQFNQAIMGLTVRVASYLFLLTDEYPTIEANEKYSVQFPDVQGGKILNRGMPLVKWLLAIPLYIVGLVYLVYTFILTVVAWFTILVTGTYPAWCAEGVIGTIAFWNRVNGYAFALVTDEYPSFAL